MTKIKPYSEKRYFYHLEVLPPAYMNGAGFLVGVPWSHRQCTVTRRYNQPTYAAFFQFGTSFYEAEEPLTLAEYKAIKPNDFRALILSTARPTEQKEPPL